MQAPASFFLWHTFKKYGTPQRPTGIKEPQPFSRPSQDADAFRPVATQAQDVGPSAKTEVQISQSDEKKQSQQLDRLLPCPALDKAV